MAVLEGGPGRAVVAPAAAASAWTCRNRAAKVSAKPSTWPPGSAAARRAEAVHQAGVALQDLVRPPRGGRSRGGRAPRTPRPPMASDPAISQRIAFFRPWLTWLTVSEPRAPFGIAQQDQPRVLGLDPHRLGRAPGAREGLDRPGGLLPLGDEGGEVGEAPPRAASRRRTQVRSSQWVPMSPTARSAPPASGSSRQFQSVSSASQSWR